MQLNFSETGIYTRAMDEALTPKAQEKLGFQQRSWRIV